MEQQQENGNSVFLPFQVSSNYNEESESLRSDARMTTTTTTTNTTANTPKDTKDKGKCCTCSLSLAYTQVYYRYWNNNNP